MCSHPLLVLLSGKDLDAAGQPAGSPLPSGQDVIQPLGAPMAAPGNHMLLGRADSIAFSIDYGPDFSSMFDAWGTSANHFLISNFHRRSRTPHIQPLTVKTMVLAPLADPGRRNPALETEIQPRKLKEAEFQPKRP